MKQADLIPLVAKLAQNKEELQSKFNSGTYPTVISFAKYHGIPRSAADTILSMLEIEVPTRRSMGRKKKVCYSSILTVLARIAKELNINHDEIKPYL